MKFINKLQGKNVLVFGGTSGIGYAVVEAAIENAANVIITGSNQPKLDNTVDRLMKSYPDIPNLRQRITTVEADLADVEKLENNIIKVLKSATKEKTNLLNHVAFTAGNSFNVPGLKDVTLDHIRGIQTVRFYAPIFIGKHIASYVEQSADSSFTLTSGVNTDKPNPNWPLQVSIGGSVEALGRSMAIDLGPVRVNTVSPGATATELLLGSASKEMIESWGQKYPVKKIGKPEDVAEAYLYCMRDGFVTGSNIKSNGGHLLV